MTIKRETAMTLIFGGEGAKRFTQNSPILPDVWMELLEHPAEPLDLLLTPHRMSSPGALHRAVFSEREKWRPAARERGLWPSARRGLRGEKDLLPLTYDESYVAAHFWFDEVIRCALPLSPWWRKVMDPLRKLEMFHASSKQQVEQISVALAAKKKPDETESPIPSETLWFLRILGWLVWDYQREARREGRRPRRRAVSRTEGQEFGEMEELATAVSKASRPDEKTLARAALLLLDGLAVTPETKHAQLWSVSRNRPAAPAIVFSTKTIKADAARSLFNVNCSGIHWAVLDTGIDATHPAFRAQGAREGAAFATAGGAEEFRTRVVKTFDFTRFRTLLEPEGVAEEGILPSNEKLRAMRELKNAFKSGRFINWELYQPLLRVPHQRGPGGYRIPRHPHGTHVAGILGANWRRRPDLPADMLGICPDITLYDFRVMDDAGQGTEFTVTAALQFIRHLSPLGYTGDPRSQSEPFDSPQGGQLRLRAHPGVR